MHDLVKQFWFPSPAVRPVGTFESPTHGIGNAVASRIYPWGQIPGTPELVTAMASGAITQDQRSGPGVLRNRERAAPPPIFSAQCEM